MRKLLLTILFCLIAVNAWAIDIDAYDSLILHLDGTDDSTNDSDFVDSSLSPLTVTQTGDAKLENTWKKFGVTSCYVDGSGDAIVVADDDSLSFGSGDFTIDFWWYPTVDGFTGFIDKIAGTQRDYEFYYSETGAVITFIYSTNGTTNTDTANFTWDMPSANTEYHIALIRNGADLVCYVNGTKVGDTYNASTDSIANSTTDFEMMKIGTGYIDEVRVSKGIARWTTDFTPPTAAYGETATSNSQVITVDLT